MNVIFILSFLFRLILNLGKTSPLSVVGCQPSYLSFCFGNGTPFESFLWSFSSCGPGTVGTGGLVSIRLALPGDQIAGKSSGLTTGSGCYLRSRASVQVSFTPPALHPCGLPQDALSLAVFPREGPEACLPWTFLTTRKAFFLIVIRMVFNHFKQILSPPSPRYSLLWWFFFLMLELKKTKELKSL